MTILWMNRLPLIITSASPSQTTSKILYSFAKFRALRHARASTVAADLGTGMIHDQTH